MVKQLFKILVVGSMLGCFSTQVARAQFRGGSRDGGDDRSREEMRRRFEEMRSRGGFGGFGSSRGGDDRSRGFGGFGGSDRGGFGGFGGWDRSRGGDDRSRGGFGGFGSSRGGDDRGSDRSRGGFGGFGSSRGGDDRSRGGDSRSGQSNKPAPYVPATQAPITVDLPGNYAEGDSDRDGQITLLEWRRWKPQEIGRFMAMDSNNDGFLTAREVIIAENFPNETPAAASSNNYASAASSYSPTPTPTPQTVGRDSEGNPSAGEKPSAAEARYVFTALDKDRNGSISAEEWEKSKKIREGFERAGVTLKVPADLGGFVTQYPAYRIVPQLTLPSN